MNYSGCKRYWPSNVILALVSINGNSSRDPLICSYFKEEIRLASPISMETRERSTPHSHLDWPKENTRTLELRSELLPGDLTVTSKGGPDLCCYNFDPPRRGG